VIAVAIIATFVAGLSFGALSGIMFAAWATDLKDSQAAKEDDK
jgi:hypothetical protein